MRAPLAILHQDEHLVVVFKPAGVLSVGGTASDSAALPELLAEQGLPLIAVHRLDRDVSGAVIFARDEETRARLEDIFRARAIRKTYWAMAQGRVRPPAGEWKFPIVEEGAFARVSGAGKPSTTRYRTLHAFANATELEIDLVTGRYNQIRLHAAHARFPLVGERKYARGKDSTVRFKSRRVALHAWKLAFAHPHSGRALEIEAPLPQDLTELLARVASDVPRHGSEPERRKRG